MKFALPIQHHKQFSAEYSQTGIFLRVEAPFLLQKRGQRDLQGVVLQKKERRKNLAFPPDILILSDVKRVRNVLTPSTVIPRGLASQVLCSPPL